MPDVGPTRYEDYEAYSRNRIDYQLANLLHGDHPIEGNHEIKVIQLAELTVLHDATEKAGWHRHTGDWDWGATITLDDGTTIGDTVWSIDFILPKGIKPNEFNACVDYDKVRKVRVEGQGYNQETDEVYDIATNVPINRITNIYWEWR